MINRMGEASSYAGVGLVVQAIHGAARGHWVLAVMTALAGVAAILKPDPPRGPEILRMTKYPANK